MSETAALVPLHQLVESCTPGEWGDDPVNGSANCVVYRATDIDSEGKLNEAGGAARCVAPSKLLAKFLRPGDILLEASGGSPDQPVGRVALFAGAGQMPAVVSNFFRSMRPRSGVDPRFLVQQLVALNRGPAILRYQQQTTGLTNLKVSDYLTHRLWVPDLPSQRRIAAILTSLDTAIEATEALIEKHQQIKAGLMHDLFSFGVLPSGQRRPLAQCMSGAESSGGLLSTGQGWEMVPASRVCSLITKGTTPPAEEMWQAGNGVRFLRVDNLTFNGELNFGASDFRISPKTHATTLARSRCQQDDVLMNIVGPPLGKVGLVHDEEVNINQAIAVFRPAQAINARYLLLWLTSEPAKRWILQRAKQTSGQVNVTLAMCQALPIPLAPVDEQNRIVDRVTSAEAALSSLSLQAEKLRAQKQGLMQDLLTGKVRVPVPAEASA